MRGEIVYKGTTYKIATSVIQVNPKQWGQATFPKEKETNGK